MISYSNTAMIIDTEPIPSFQKTNSDRPMPIPLARGANIFIDKPEKMDIDTEDDPMEIDTVVTSPLYKRQCIWNNPTNCSLTYHINFNLNS